MLNILRIARLGADAARWAAPHVQEWKRARNVNEDEAWRNLASKNWAESEKYFHLALAEPRHGEAKQLEFMLGLAEAQRKQTHFGPSEETARKAIELATRLKNHPQRLAAMDILAELYVEQGRQAEAVPIAQEIVQLERSRPRPDYQRLVAHLRKLGEVYLLVGDLDKAAEVCEECVKLAEETFGSEDGETADCLTGLGAVLRRLGKHEDAQLFLRGALEIHRRVRGQDSPDVTRDLDHLAGSLEDSGKLEAAAAEYEKALSLRERQIGVDPEETAWLKIRLGSLYLQTGRSSASRELLTHAIRVLEKSATDRYLMALEIMAQAEEHAGRGKEAVRLRYRAEQVLATRVAPLQLKSYDLAENLSVMPAPMTAPTSLWRDTSAGTEPAHASVPEPSALAIWKPQAPTRDLGDLERLFQTLSSQLGANGQSSPASLAQPPVSQPGSATEADGINPADAGFASFYRPTPPNAQPWNPAASQSDGLERLAQQVIQSGVFQPGGARAEGQATPLGAFESGSLSRSENASSASALEGSSVGGPENRPERNPASVRASVPKYVTLTDSAAEPHTYILTPLTLPAGQADPERTAALFAALSRQAVSGQAASQTLPSPAALSASPAISSPETAEPRQDAHEANDKRTSVKLTAEPKAIQPSLPLPKPAASDYRSAEINGLALAAASPEIQQSLPNLQAHAPQTEPALQVLVKIPLAKTSQTELRTGPRKPESIEAESGVLVTSPASWAVQLPLSLARLATESHEFVDSPATEVAAPSAAGRVALPLARAVASAHTAIEIPPSFSSAMGNPVLPEASWEASSQSGVGSLDANAYMESLPQAGSVPISVARIGQRPRVDSVHSLKVDPTPETASPFPAHRASGLIAEAPSQVPISAPPVAVPLPGALARPWKDRRQPRVAPQFPEDRVSLPATGVAQSHAGIPAQANGVRIAVYGAAQLRHQFSCAPDFAAARLNLPGPYQGQSKERPDAQPDHAAKLPIRVAAGQPPTNAGAPLPTEALTYSATRFPAQLPGNETPFVLLSALKTSVPEGGFLRSQTQIGQFSPEGGGLYSIRTADVRAWMPRYRDTRVLYPRPNQHKLSGDDLIPVDPPQSFQQDREEPNDGQPPMGEASVLPAISQPPVGSVAEVSLPIFGVEDKTASTDEDLPLF